MNPKFDERDAELLADRQAQRAKQDGPRVGDFIKMADGRTLRFSHHWGDEIQVSEGGSFYLAHCGSMSFSGGLEPGVPVEEIEDTAREAAGSCWFFHHDRPRAHNGVHCVAFCRVYKQNATA